MESVASAIHREPWEQGKIVGQKSPRSVKDIWVLRATTDGAPNPGACTFQPGYRQQIAGL